MCAREECDIPHTHIASLGLKVGGEHWRAHTRTHAHIKTTRTPFTFPSLRAGEAHGKHTECATDISAMTSFHLYNARTHAVPTRTEN